MSNERRIKGKRQRELTSLTRLGLEHRGHDGPHLLVLGPLLGFLLLPTLSLAASTGPASYGTARAAQRRAATSAAAAAGGLELGHAPGADLA